MSVALSAAAGEAIFWIAVLSSVVAEIAIIRAVVRVRRNATAPAADVALPPVRRTGEIV